MIAVPTNVIYDNQSAQKLVQNHVYNSCTKHIDIHHHFVWNVFDDGEIDLKCITSENIPADVLTKALKANKHKLCCELTG